MAVQVQSSASERLLEVHASGTLTREDYELFVPDVERKIQAFGKVRILFEMHDFHGWNAGALWEDVKFDSRHFNDIERLAIVGEKRWQQGMAGFCRPFTTAMIRYFEHSHIEQARAWLREP